MIGVFLSTIFIPELFLKLKTLEPIRDRVGSFNNYTAVPIFGLIIGLNIEVGSLFDGEIIFPFIALAIVLITMQYLSTSISLIFTPVSKGERDIITFGSFAKSELSLIIALLSIFYGAIDVGVFTASVVIIAILNALTWHKLKSVEMEK
jgi:hypothetical protein